MTTINDDIVAGLTAQDVATVIGVLAAPPLTGLGIDPFAGFSSDEQVAAMYASMTALADRGYATSNGDDFTLSSQIRQLITAAAWPAAVIRVVEFAEGQPDRLAFVYGIRDLAIVQSIDADGLHSFVPKTLQEAVTDVGVLALSYANAEGDETSAIVITRNELMAETSITSAGDAANETLLIAARTAGTSGNGLRIDLAWIAQDLAIEPYVAIVGKEDQRWMLSGIGQAPDDLVTCRPAFAEHVVSAFQAMLQGSAFDVSAATAQVSGK